MTARSRSLLSACMAVAVLWPSVSHAAPVTIFPTPTTGYTTTYSGSTLSYTPITGYSGWYYWGRGNATVGITDTYPRSGTGSFYLQGVNMASQGGVLYTPATIIGSTILYTSSIGRLANFVGGSYDWYRDSTSTNPAVQAPAFALIVDFDGNLFTIGDQRNLVYEPVYNGTPTAPTNTWQTENITTSSNFWSTYDSSLGYYSNLNQWINKYPNALVLGVAAYFGSGWNGQFRGAVDNLTWQFSNQQPAGPFNFEVEVPEPASLAALGVALAGVGLAYRRRLRRDC